MDIQYYAVTDSNNFPITFYGTDIYPPQSNGALNTNIPNTSISITKDEWQECINNNGLRKIINGVVIKYNPITTNTVIVPSQVTNYQARAALIEANLFSIADSAIRAANDALTIAAWDYANIFYRDSPFIINIGSTLSLSNTQIDNLFIAAGNVN